MPSAATSPASAPGSALRRGIAACTWLVGLALAVLTPLVAVVLGAGGVAFGLAAARPTRTTRRLVLASVVVILVATLCISLALPTSVSDGPGSITPG